jgi:signal transduction histidine kinase
VAAVGLGAADLSWGVESERGSVRGIVLLMLGVAAGLSFVGGGLVTRAQVAGGHGGGLMIGIGLLVLLAGVSYVPGRAAELLGNVSGLLVLTLLAHLVLTLPEGRARSRTLVMVLYGGMSASFLAWAADGPRALTVAMAVYLWVFGAVLAWDLVWRWLVRVPLPRRHTFAPVALAGGVMVVTMWTRQGVGIWPGEEPASSLEPVLHLGALAALTLWPMAVLAGVLRGRLDHVAVVHVAAQVDRTPEALEGVLATVLRDPSLRLVHRTEDGYTGVDGRPVRPPGAGRSVISLGGSVMLAYDAALDLDPALVRSAAAIARLVMENERMRDELATRLAEVRASRARIVAAGDAERRRIERNLHDGAQQRLAGLAVTLGRIKVRSGTAELTELADEAATGLRDAMAELRELAGGIHPVILTEAGLGAALRSLAESAAVPVTVDAPGGRLPTAVEQAMYFVAAEALANAVKHAGASAVRVSVQVADGLLKLDVHDDGVGGAGLEGGGTGLRGLADRVAALDGTLHIDSPAGQGTALSVELPVQERR